MIRVCVVAPAYMTGGQAIEARTLVDGFAREPDFRVELQPIDPRIPGWLARIRGVRTLARLPLYLGGLVRRIRRADVVHVFTAAFWPFLLTTTPAVLLARAFGKPVVLNYRDGRAADHIGAGWVRFVLRRATLLVFPSGFLRDVSAASGWTARWSPTWSTPSDSVIAGGPGPAGADLLPAAGGTLRGGEHDPRVRPGPREYPARPG